MRGWDGVEVNVNDPVQLTHRRHRCRRQLFEIELAVAHVPSKVNGAQITYRGFILGTDFNDLGAEIGQMDSAARHSGLIAFTVAGILEAHPAVASLSQSFHHAGIYF